jgi:hypothetical protein
MGDLAAVRDETWWWPSEDGIRDTGISLVKIPPTKFDVGGPSINAFQVDASDYEAGHLLIAIIGTKGSAGSPPSAYSFFVDPAGENPVNVLSGFSSQLIGSFDGSIFEPLSQAWAYLYVVENTGTVNASPTNSGDGPGGFAVWAIQNLVDIVDPTFEVPSPDLALSFGPTSSGEDNGLWVFVAFPAFTQITLGSESDDPLPAEPIVVTAGAGEISETVEFGVLPEDGFDPNPVGGAFIQLLATPILVPFIPPTTEIVTTFTADIDTLLGVHEDLPPAHLITTFTATVTLPPASTEWRAVLVDANGTTIARMPRAVIGEIVETLNDIDTADVTIPIRSAAGALIDTAEVLPELEVQIWRGDVLWLWGPIVDAVPEGDHWTLSVRDARWHLTRRHVGELGGTFGGKPPYFHDEMVNQRFERGNLSGWSILRSVTVGEFVGFDAPEVGAVRIAPDTRMPSGEPMVRCVAPLDPLDNYQLFQDLWIRLPQDGRELNVTFSGWWLLPTGGNFAPNNLQMGLLLATLDLDVDLPGGYYQPLDWAFDPPLDEQSPLDKFFYQEVKLTLPPGEEALVHVAVCFPQGVSFVGGLDLQVDDGLLYNESPSTIGPGLVMHAQDAAFSKSDVNLDWVANTVGDQVIRDYLFRDHTNVAQAIQGLASDGWFDWSMAYTPTARIVEFTAPRRGSHRPGARCRLDANGRGNVDRITRRRMWQSGSTVVAAQTRTGGNHERAARSDHDLTLEEVFVAPREPRDYDLAGIAETRLGPAVDATVIEVETRSGDERLLVDLEVGDTTDLVGLVPGHRAVGVHRLVRRQIDPTNDRATLVLNPA